MEQWMMRDVRSVLCSVIAIAGLLMTAHAAAGLSPQEVSAQAPPSAAPAEALPPAAEILAKAVDAMGGEKAFEAIKSLRMEVTTTARGKDSRTELWAMAPDKVVVKQSYPNAPIVVTMGRNGDIAWVDALGEVRQTPAARLAHFLDLAGIHRTVLDMQHDYGTIETVGREPFGEEDCYKLRLAGKKEYGPDEGKGDRFAYFSVETGRLVAVDAPQKKSPKLRAVAEYSEWKKFGTVKLFTRIDAKPSQMGIPKIIKIGTVEFNEVDESVFAVPEQLKQPAENEGPAEP